MTSEEHLQTSDILLFRERKLSATDHTAATRHLLQCPECRNRLPLPTADELWRAVMGGEEETLEATGIGAGGTSAKNYLAGKLFGQQALRNAIFASFLVIAILGFSLFLFMPGGHSENENLVGAVGDTDLHDVIHQVNPDEPIHDEAANTEDSASSPGSSRLRSETADTKSSKATVDRKKETVQKANKRPFPSTRPPRQAETRGNVPCGGQRSVGLEARNTEEGLLLKWDKIAGAISYNVYLSDLDERLVDHFETADQTSHVVPTKLNEETVYRLRLIAKLESGERVVSESQNFKIGYLIKGSQSPGNLTIRKKTAASVRCVEVKQ